MTSTTSSISKKKELKETYLWALKKHKGISALLALLMFMALPMLLIMIMPNLKTRVYPAIARDESTKYFIERIAELNAFFVVPLILIFTILFSALLFGYMHQKRSVDLFHSLPVGRTPMMLGRLLAGFTLITAPVLLNFAITFIVGACYSVDISQCYGTVSYMLWIILISTASLIFMALMAVCTGTTFDMIISALGVNLGYPLFIFLGNYLISSILPGYGNQVDIGSLILTALSPFAAAFMPLMRANEFNSGIINQSFFIWWLIFSIILLAAAITLYNRRKSECAETGFAFPLPKTIIRFLITAVSGLGIGLALGESDEPINFFIGLISGSLAAHIVVEAVYSRGFKKLKKSFVYYGLFLAVFFVAYTIFVTGCFGYDIKVPQAEEVESIQVEGRYINSDDFNLHDKDGRTIGHITPTIKDSKNIKTITDSHKKAVLQKRSKKFPYCFDSDLLYNDFTIIYKLKNGKTLKRSYPCNIYDTQNYTNSPTDNPTDYNNLILEIKKLNEFKISGNSAFYINAEDIKSINTDNNNNEKSFSPDEKTKELFLKAWQQDILDGRTKNMLIEMESPLYYIAVEYKNPIKNNKLKEFVFGNNYNGEIYLQPNTTSVYADTKVSELIKELGWDK